MNYLVLCGIIVVLSLGYEQIKKASEFKKSFRVFLLGVIILLLCGFAGLRTSYNDTEVYIKGFEKTTQDFSTIFEGKFSLSNVYLFEIWSYAIYHYISPNPQVFLFLSSVVFVFPSILLVDKYSKNFTFSMLLFMFGGMYLFSLAGLKQTMAAGVILMGFPFLIDKKYPKFYLFCLVAIGFHAYALFFLILPLLGNDAFNKRTVLFSILIIIVGIGMSYFSVAINQIVSWLGKDVSEETLQTGSVNIFRAIVFLVPFVLTVLGRKKLDQETEGEKWLIKTGILSSVFMVLALFGNPILFGRIPQYFLIGIVVTMPLLIDKVFDKKDQSIVLFIAVICYVAYGVYGLYVDGAFAEDVFKLIEF